MYDYQGSGGGYMSRMSMGGEMPNSRPRPLPGVGNYSPQFNAGLTHNDQDRANNATRYKYDMEVGPLQAQADMADRSTTLKHNLSMEELRLKMQMEEQARWGQRGDMRYQHYLQYGE
jgi:hypothetical protein